MKKSSTSVPQVDFDLRQLEIFLKVVELESFSKAGEAVHLAQASVSERIATLESMVGVKLLDRMGRTVTATKAGELLYHHAQRLLEGKKAACLEMQDFLGVKQGEISIGGSTIPAEYILPKVIGLLSKEYTRITVTLTVADSEEIERRVLNGEFEIGVIGRKGSNKNIANHELWEDELVLAIPSTHRWAGKKEVTIRDVIYEPFILREIGSGTLKSMEPYLQGAGLEGIDSLNVVARLGTSTAVKEGVKAGLGISILSAIALETELKAGVLKALRLKGIPMFRYFYLIRDTRRTASPLSRSLMDFIIATSRQR
ncbi:MAG: selenium metabolism-associated LysR family transcriptional regulator [Deltaproteobacteria bacterium]